jgi:hypothetical protein
VLRCRALYMPDKITPFKFDVQEGFISAKGKTQLQLNMKNNLCVYPFNEFATDAEILRASVQCMQNNNKINGKTINNLKDLKLVIEAGVFDLLIGQISEETFSSALSEYMVGNIVMEDYKQCFELLNSNLKKNVKTNTFSPLVRFGGLKDLHVYFSDYIQKYISFLYIYQGEETNIVLQSQYERILTIDSKATINDEPHPMRSSYLDERYVFFNSLLGPDRDKDVAWNRLVLFNSDRPYIFNREMIESKMTTRQFAMTYNALVMYTLHEEGETVTFGQVIYIKNMHLCKLN